MKENNQVNHPNHYNQYRGFEVIDVCEQLMAPDGSGNFNRGNAFKYLARAGWKNIDKQVEDLEKAQFYIQREIDRVKNLSTEQPKTEGHWLDGMNFVSAGYIHDYKACPDCNAQLTDDRMIEFGRFSCPKGCGHMKFNNNKKEWFKTNNKGNK